MGLTQSNISEKCVVYVRKLCRSQSASIVNFPLKEKMSVLGISLEDVKDPGFLFDFLSEEQLKHREDICKEVIELDKLRRSVCPMIITENEFWLNYFFVINQLGVYLHDEDELPDPLFREENHENTFSYIFAHKDKKDLLSSSPPPNLSPPISISSISPSSSPETSPRSSISSTFSVPDSPSLFPCERSASSDETSEIDSHLSCKDAKPFSLSSTTGCFILSTNHEWGHDNGFRDPKKYVQTNYTSPDEIEKSRLKEWIRDWKFDYFTVHQSNNKTIVKRLLSYGVPDSKRKQVWKTLSGVSSVRVSSKYYYSDALMSFFGFHIPHVYESVGCFGGRYPPWSDEHALVPEYLFSLRRILISLSLENHYLEYCPYIPEICTICLYFLPEHEAFCLIDILIKKSNKQIHWVLPNRYSFSLFLLFWTRLVKEKLPSISEHLERIGVSIMEVGQLWFSRFFVGILPLQDVFRVFDWWLYQGNRILLSVGLSLLSNFSSSIVNLNSYDDFQDLFRQFYSFKPPKKSLHVPLLKSKVRMREYRRGMEKLIREAKDFYGLVIKNTIFTSPYIETPSEIISLFQWEVIYSWIPVREIYHSPKLIFKTSKDGFSLTTFYSNCSKKSPTILLLRTRDSNVFGAYLSEEWRPQSEGYYGTGETFLFQLVPKEKRWYWKDDFSSFFIRTERTSISIGGSSIDSGGTGLWLDDELLYGFSERCSTFHNQPLNGDKKNFECVTLEVYHLD